MRYRFTQQKLADLQTERAQEFVFDDLVKALACRVTKAGTKSFYLVKRHDGKVKQIRICAVGDMPIPEVRRVAAEMVLQLVSGKTPDADRRPRKRGVALAVIFAEYLNFTREHRKPRTVNEYAWQWEKHLRAWAGDRMLAEIRRRDVSALHLKLGKEHGHHLANRVLALLRATINRAIREHELDLPNPAAGIHQYREDSRTRRLTADELPAFFKAVREEPNTDIRDFVLLALFTGVRKSNLLAMRWEYLSLDTGVWTIPSQQSKTGVELTVGLISFALDILQARRQTISGAFVFPGMRGAEHMMDPKMGWKRILERAGLKDLRMHDLRRSLASFQIDTGSPLEVIQKTLGHGNKSTTEIYARLAMDPVLASMEKAVRAMLGEGRGADSGQASDGK